MVAESKLKELWLEFEAWKGDGRAQIERDYFNMVLHLVDGRSYAISVCTFAYLRDAPEEIRKDGEGRVFMVAPDLIVESAERESLEEVAKSLIERGLLWDEWLVQR